MTGYFSEFRANSVLEGEAPLDVEARLVAPLYANIAPLLIGHTAGLGLAGVSILHVGGAWSYGLTVASVLALGLRAWVFRRIARIPASPTPRDLLEVRLPYQAVGLVWCVVSAALTAFCFLFGDEPLRFFTALVTLGTTAGIASRNASAPHYALIEIAIWLLPVGTLALRLDYGGSLVFLLMAIYFVALQTIVRRRYVELVAMIDAERRSRRAQDALSEREAALRTIFDSAAAGVAEVDVRQRRFVRVNKVFCDMVGRREHELVGDFDPPRVIDPGDFAEHSQQWSDLRDTGQPFEGERRYVHADGTIVWAQLCVAVCQSDAEGRPLRAVAMVQNITKRKAAEAALRASQDLLVLSLEIGSVGTFRRDYVAGVIHCGKETRLMNALPLGDEPVSDEYFMKTILPEDVPRFLKYAADALGERRPIATFDYRFFHPEKGIRFAETRSRIEYDEDGRPVASVGVVIDVTDRREAESRLVHLAHHDPLTDLPNRSLFQTRLKTIIEHARPGEQFGILCLDLDRFKEVNDSFGHPVGDCLLRAVTGRLHGACRSTDTIARLGGDEFAVILSPIRHRTDAAAFAERITELLTVPYNIDGQRIVIGASIGIAIAPGDGVDPDRLLSNADLALYSAKEEGRGRHRFFEHAMHKKVQARRALDGDLRQALDDGSLELFYQPLIGVGTNQLRGFEALIRWRHPDRGLVMPDAFIPLAESNGLIVPIGAFVLERACAQAALWPNEASIAVNLSASEFTSPYLFETIAVALRRSALDPKRLELEITESTMLRDTRATIETLHKLKTIGVRISIDDFGTGFSSLGYLQRFAFDKVKIDRSFIAPLGRTRESLAIVGAVINLCTGLDIETTAEGVETDVQLAILAGLGCTEAQGYYFSCPRPGDEIPDWIAKRELAMPAGASFRAADVGNRGPRSKRELQ